MIKLIIFDLDGTLLNSIEDLAAAGNYALKKNQLPTHEVAAYKQFVGSGVGVLVQRMIDSTLHNEAILDKVTKDFHTYYDAHNQVYTAPYESIVALLEELKRLNIQRAVLTNKPHEYACRLTQFYFGEFIDQTVGQSEQIPIKPDPKGLNYLLTAMNISKQECLYLGDSDVDMMTGKNGGIISIGVTWGFRDEAELRRAGADYIIETPLELLEIIESKNKE